MAKIETKSEGWHWRNRIGMYLSGDAVEALCLGLREIYVNSLDNITRNRIKKGAVDVLIDSAEHQITVADNGTGISYSTLGDLTTLQAAFLKGRTGENFSSSSANLIGTNGVGAKVVIATAARAEIISRTKSHTESFTTFATDDGAEIKDAKTTPSSNQTTGLTVQYTPDPFIYKDAWFTFEQLDAEFKEFLQFYPDCTLTLNFDGSIHKYNFPKGIRTPNTKLYVASENVAIALSVSAEPLAFYCNRLRMPDGGAAFTHFKTQFTKNFNSISGGKFSGSQIFSTIGGKVAIFVNNPQFSNQAKTAASNKEHNQEITQLIKDILEEFAETLQYKTLIADLELEKKADEAAAAARSKIKQIQEKTSRKRLSIDADKLTDCAQKDRAKCELWITEGNSAGNGLEKARDPQTQAIMRLRGKIINAGKADFLKLIENAEVQTIIKAIGGEILDNSISIQKNKLRYDRIILCADRDSDGSHITCLLLAFFYYHMPSLIKWGKVYLSCGALYRVDWGKDSYKYIKDDAELKTFTKILKSKYTISRMKGWGECDPAELKEMFLDYKKRRLELITIEDAAKTVKEFELMEKDVAARKQLWDEIDYE